MDTPGWLSQRHADVPAGDGWLSDGERRVLAGLGIAKRRADWRLGRWTAKRALSARLGIAPDRVEVFAAPDGAPEAWLDGDRVPVSVSLSHRAGRGLAVVSDAATSSGCDLELLEMRSDAFVREWLAPVERRLVFDCDEGRRPLLANLIWSAKEAAAKVRREGLRLDVRRAVVQLDDTDSEPEDWRPFAVQWTGGGGIVHGWWRADPGWVMAIAGQPRPDVPYELTVR